MQIDGSGRRRLEPARSAWPVTAAVKVPAVGILFWFVKALTTAFGESTSDFLVHSMAPVLAVLLGFGAFLVALGVQFSARRYAAVRYWFAVAMVGVFGTMAADVLHVGFRVPYLASAVLFGVVLAAVFLLWFRTERTLSMHSVNTPRRELFYWAAVVATFALGTAVGDLTANTFRLGYLASGIVFAAAILVPAVAYRWFGLNGVAAFWSAYVLTRPVGASFADWFGVSKARGGLALGPGPVAVVLGLLILGTVAYLARTGADAPPPGSTGSDRFPDGAASNGAASNRAASNGAASNGAASNRAAHRPPDSLSAG